jgi:RNA 3'-terminal phosphate cyclase (ATP)
MLVIDGSYGEGGGQVLRTSLTLASITGVPVRIERIRAGRPRPGLRPQHLTAVRAAAAICEARLEGDDIGSQTLAFVPGSSTRPGNYLFDVAEAAQGGSAGSVGLVLQTVLLPLALAGEPSTLAIRGGTHVPWAPSASYLEHVYAPSLAQMGARAQIELKRWGFYPAGGGEVRVHIPRCERPLRPLVLAERGELEHAYGTAVAMNLPSHIAQRMSVRAHRVMAEAGVQAHVKPLRVRGHGPGAGIFLFARYTHATAGFTAYGRKGLPSERVADAACRDFTTHHHSGAPVDLHLADQLVLPMALAEGRSALMTSCVTQHLLTNAWVLRQFMNVEIDVQQEAGRKGRLIVEGKGL